MNVESFVSGLNRGEMLDAMELIWAKLSSDPDTLDSPDWHNQVIADRLENPPNSPLDLADSKTEIEGRLNARRTQG